MTHTLILLNAVIFILQTTYLPLTYMFAMVPAEIISGQNLHTLITRMFLHGDFFHLLINMYFLYIFGSVVEHEMHPFIYLGIYLLSGIVGSFGHILISYTLTVVDPFRLLIPTIGASGAIFGIITGFAVLYPNVELFILFLPIPIKAKYLVPGIIFLEIVFGIANFQWDNIAHYAHLGGAIVGFIIVRYWKKNQFRIY